MAPNTSNKSRRRYGTVAIGGGGTAKGCVLSSLIRKLRYYLQMKKKTKRRRFTSFRIGNDVSNRFVREMCTGGAFFCFNRFERFTNYLVVLRGSYTIDGPLSFFEFRRLFLFPTKRNALPRFLPQSQKTIRRILK